MAASTTVTAAQLDYGLAPPRRGRRLRRAALLAVLLIVGLAGWRWGPAAWKQAGVLYWQRRCMAYSPRAEQVVYEENAAEAQRLIAGGGEYVPYPLRRAPQPAPALWNAAARAPTCWTRYQALTGLPTWSMRGNGPAAILFLHERVSPGGNRRLVILRYFPGLDTFTTGFIDGYNYDAMVVTPATWKTPVRETPRMYALDVLSGWPRKPPDVRVYAGQIDPADASQFTVRYEMWGQVDILDGRLDDKDNVTLTPRKSPTMPP